MTDPKLKSLVERIERLIEERQGIGADIRDLFTEAKSAGYEPKAMRKVIARRAANPDELARDEALIETYEAALGAVGEALADIRKGATWKAASEKHGVPRATMARAAAVSKRREVIPEEDAAPNLGSDEQCDALAATHDTTEERGAPNVPCDGGAPVETSTVGPAVTTPFMSNNRELN
jgi:uncharacterized protein (UPF0335 family)